MGIFDKLFGKKETTSKPKKEVEEPKKECCSKKESEEKNNTMSEKIKITIGDIEVESTTEKWDELIDFMEGNWEIDEEDYEIFTRDDDMNDDLLPILDPQGEFITICKFDVVSDDPNYETILYEVSFINCECPEILQKFYKTPFFITKKGMKFVGSDSDYYNTIRDGLDEDFELEIGNSGYECFKISEFDYKSYFKLELP
tara:strand:+ start:102 stop:701 length:600 start_codon:yes stop_codon:yes gene_type:complete